jgi:hypothetical protein
MTCLIHSSGFTHSHLTVNHESSQFHLSGGSAYSGWWCTSALKLEYASKSPWKQSLMPYVSHPPRTVAFVVGVENLIASSLLGKTECLVTSVLDWR